MKNKLLFTILFLVLVLLNAPMQADVHLAETPSYSDVSKAVADASSGDTVLVQAGTAVWTSALTLTRSVKLVGSGIDNTIIKNGMVANTFLITLRPAVPADDPYIEISGFTLDGNNIASCISIFGTDSTYPFTNFRIHHNKLRNVPDSRPDAYMCIRVKGNCFGLIDQNQFVNNLYDFKVYGNDKYSWDKYPGLVNIGTANYLYIENNTSTGAHSIILASGEGARWVYRYNHIDNTGTEALWDAHGDTRNYGVVGFELYENTVTNSNDPLYGKGGGLDYRGGTGIIFNNKFCAGTSGTRTKIQVREEYNSTGDGVLGCWCPVNNGYIWNNRNSRDNKIVAIWHEEFDLHNCIEEDRDWWDDATREAGGESPSNFIDGTEANRPAICAVNDCYWATDTRKLYRCTTTNNWTFIYTPYTYPHPLDLTNRDISLTPGWNWISFNVQPADLSLNSIFSGILAQVEQVKAQTQSAIRSSNTWKGDLTDMNGIGQYKMFKVKVNATCTLTVTGTAIASTTPISLTDGWNWVAYLSTTTMPIGTALDSIKGQVLQVKSRTASATYSGGVWSGVLTQLEPGQGYAVKMSAPGILTYPAATTMVK
jgi:hypothetical protein